MECDLDLDVDGLANYVAIHPDIKGIDQAKARLIAERLIELRAASVLITPIKKDVGCGDPTSSFSGLNRPRRSGARLRLASVYSFSMPMAWSKPRLVVFRSHFNFLSAALTKP